MQIDLSKIREVAAGGGAASPSTILALLDRLEASEAREIELVETLQHIRGVSSCCDVWDHIDDVVPFDPALYS
ncbi:MAG: hypothetical protein CMK74_20410 [Pseudomonadales bacterium]|nr:hypothetical protein [Pseudomonadales bacterium]